MVRGLSLAGSAAVIVAAVVAAGAGAQEKGTAVGRVDLGNGKIVVSVLPALGARVVVLRTLSGENLLDSDSRHWQPPFPAPSLDAPFRAWNGRIVWVGPQSAFWSQQELRPERVNDRWPPDPFNECGRFAVVERSPAHLRLQGEVSPVTGLALEHEIEITGERTVRMRTTARNGRSTAVAWDLWPNTRVRPDAFPYVPLDPVHPLRMDGPMASDAEAGPYPYVEREGWVTLPPGHRPNMGRKKIWAKAFVRPASGLVACFAGRQLLLVRGPLLPKARLHPEHAQVEIYRGAGEGGTILEVEMHGAYERLAPGATMSFEQTFELLDYDGRSTLEAHLSRLADVAR